MLSDQMLMWQIFCLMELFTILDVNIDYQKVVLQLKAEMLYPCTFSLCWLVIDQSMGPGFYLSASRSGAFVAQLFHPMP